MSNEEAHKRLAVVKGELEMYYQPKPDGHELEEGAKIYSAKNFDSLCLEQIKLSKQLGLN
jgi:hypothetical protein